MWNPYGNGEGGFSRSNSFREIDGDDEEELRWAALERLPTYNRVRRGLLRTDAGGFSEIEVSDLGGSDRTAVIHRLLGKNADAEDLFSRIRQRIDA